MRAYLALLLALAPFPAVGNLPPDVPAADVRLAPTYDFASLSWRDASRLQGRRATFRIILDSDHDHEDGYTLFDCAGTDDTHRTVWFAGDEEGEEEMTVEATLQVIHHAGWGPFPAFTEYRLLDARRR